MTHKFGADPNALVYNGRVYIYMTNDQFEYDGDGNVTDNTYSKIRTYNLISSEDLMNWTDHGEIPVAGLRGAAKWASQSWAPAIAHKEINGKDKFFLYFANNASNIGVLTSDHPIGPWEDPIGQPIVDRNTPGSEGVEWIFDPAVLVDDDGKAYLYYGGGVPGGGNPTQEQAKHPKTARVIELSDDMLSTVGEAQVIDAPYMFEAAEIHKYNGKYYFSYSTNFSGDRPAGAPKHGEIAYMIGDHPMGPFTYVDSVLKNPSAFFGVGGNNHHDFFEFNGEWYITYHAQTVAKELGAAQGYRSPHINKVEYDEAGKIIDIQADLEGVDQLTTLDPYKRTEAETIAWNAGISTEQSTASGSFVEDINMNLTELNNGDWFAVANADFGEDGPTSFEANVASDVGGKIEIRIDSPEGEVIGTLDIEPTGGEQEWEVITTKVKKVTGVHHLFFVITGEEDTDLFKIDYWKFYQSDTTIQPFQYLLLSLFVLAVGGGAYFFFRRKSKST